MLQVELDCGAPGTSAQQTEYTDAQCTNRSTDTHTHTHTKKSRDVRFEKH